MMTTPFVIDFSHVVQLIGAVSFVRILLIMAGIEPNPGPTDKFIFRYQYLLVQIGTGVLRKVFDILVNNDFMQYLNANPTQNNQLQFLMIKDIITDAQKKLLPPIDLKPNSSNFDVTLLACLLRNVCGLRGQKDTVWINPGPTDLSMEADIARLRECRNNLLHSGTVLISEADLTLKWNELRVILNRLNNTCKIVDLPKQIDDAEHMDVDEELKSHYNDIIKCWCEMDRSFDHGVRDLERKFEDFERGQAELKLGVAGIQKCLNERSGGDNVESETNLKHHLLEHYNRYCCTLSVSPLYNEEEEDFFQIYKPPTMDQVDYHRAERTEVNNRISTYKDIFFKNEQFFKNIYVTGDAGVGKTSLCKCLCLLWCKSQSGGTLDDKVLQSDGKSQSGDTMQDNVLQSDISGDAGVSETYLSKCLCLLWCKSQSGGKMEDIVLQSYSKSHSGDTMEDEVLQSYSKSQSGGTKEDKDIQSDINFLARFEFLFYISLRDTDCRDVVSMIVDQFYDSDSTEQHRKIETVLRQHKCLVILDALDEWTPQVRGKKECKVPFRVHSENLVFLTTCRPYQIENVRLSRQEIDQHVRVSGIHGTSSESFIVEVVNHMNKENGVNKNAKKFIRDVKQSGLDEQLYIPMITSHLVIVWFSQKLTDMSKAFLYGNILELLFKRAVMRNIESPASLTSELQLPGILSQLRYLKEHVSLLHKICLLSFRSMFKQDEDVLNLVFTRHQLMSEPYLLFDGEMNFLCKIGILSKNKVIGCFEERKQKVSFLHKSYIEFFAALFVSSFDADNVFDNVVKEWTSVDIVGQFQNFFLMLAGFSYDKVKVLFDSIYLNISDDLIVHRINAIFHYKHYLYSDQIELLQTTLINCWREGSRPNDPNTVLQIQDFIFDEDSYVETLKELLLSNASCVKSICSVKGVYYDEFDEIKNLQCVHVGAVLSDDYVKFTECMLQNQSTLHTVCIEGCDAVMPVLPMRSLQHLTSLSLSCVTIHYNSLHNLVTFLSDNILIENIKFHCVSCDNLQRGVCAYTLTLNLSHHTKLTSLWLWCVNIFCNNVNNSSLKSITLRPYSERIGRGYIDVFNSIKYSQLELLYIEGSYLNMLDYNTMKVLTDTVKTLQCIKSLKLWDMKVPDDVLLQLHPHVLQVEIQLYEVTLSRQCFHCFFESCVNHKSVIIFELRACNITSVDGETHRKLSGSEAVDYMSEYLTSIPTVNITYKNGWVLHLETRSCQ